MSRVWTTAVNFMALAAWRAANTEAADKKDTWAGGLPPGM
uniref:Uncharacterized protein n=1 Tax=Plectus sambesii TaxID=2011161 RepID=A0A914UQ22_9BILA